MPLVGSVDDGAEFGIKPDPLGANMVKALMETVAGGDKLIVTASDAKALLNFITSLRDIGLDAPLITAAPALLAAAKSVMESTDIDNIPPSLSSLRELAASIAKAEGR